MVQRMTASIDKTNRQVHRVLLAAGSRFDLLTCPASATTHVTFSHPRVTPSGATPETRFRF